MDRARLVATMTESISLGDYAANPGSGTIDLRAVIGDPEKLRRRAEFIGAELEQAHRELDAMVARHALLYELAPCGYFTLSGDGRICAVNLTGAAWLHVERARILGDAFVHHVTPEWVPAFGELLGRASRGELPVRKDLDLAVDAGRSRLPCRIEFISRETTASGESRLLCMVSDLGQLRRSSEALRRAGECLGRMSACVVGLSDDWRTDLGRLTALAGQLLGADAALYVTVDAGRATVLGRWQSPVELGSLELDVGSLCLDVLEASIAGPLVLSELILTPYVRPGPRPRACLVQPVRVGSRSLGCLCVLCREDREFEDHDRRMLGLVAAMIGREDHLRARAPEAAVEVLRRRRRPAELARGSAGAGA
jgi:PAS domain-containing protein